MFAIASHRISALRARSPVGSPSLPFAPTEVNERLGKQRFEDGTPVDRRFVDRALLHIFLPNR